MKHFPKYTFVLALLLLFCVSLSAQAAAPVLTVSSTGDGDSIKIEVAGAEAEKGVILNFRTEGVALNLSFLGYTDASGEFDKTVSSAALGVVPESAVYVTVNGVQSNSVAWPYVAAGDMITLDKTGLALSLGEVETIQVYNNGTNLLYLYGNTNPTIANANISGSKVTVTALNYGSTIITVCSQNDTTNCASAHVSVQNTGSVPLAFGRNNIGIVSGETEAIPIYGGTGVYMILSNSNGNLIQASINGHNVELTAVGSDGHAAIAVCTTDVTSCGIINANIGAVDPDELTLDRESASMTVDDTLKVNISGGSNYEVYDNSDDEVVSVGLGSDHINLTAKDSGSSEVIVCSGQGSCDIVEVTVAEKTGVDGGAIALSQNNLWLFVGQSSGVTISGGSTPYSYVNSDNILSVSIDGSVLNITGENPGSTNLSVCSAGGGCTNLAVLVNGTDVNTSLTLSQSRIAVVVDSTAVVAITGNGGYYVSNNSNPAAASVAFSGSNAVIRGEAAGTSNITICQNGGQCATVIAEVSGSSANSNTGEAAGTSGSITIGSSDYPNGTLVRNRAGKIYVMENGSPRHITTLDELRRGYAGQKIFDVVDPVMNRLMGLTTGAITISGDDYPNGTLVRNREGRIYVMENGSPRHITTLDELRRGYAGQKIFDVVDSIMSYLSGNTLSGGTNTDTSVNTGQAVPAYEFEANIVYGMSGDEVKKLQERLRAEDCYTGEIDGRYLSDTLDAVRKYQERRGIRQTGNVGPQTRASLNG